jgi:RTA1 like protein
VIGYTGRILSAKETPHYTQTPFIIQSLLILIGPAFFSASIYMILGRIILMVNGEKHAIIRPSWLTNIFVTSDVFSFLLVSRFLGIHGTKSLLDRLTRQNLARSRRWSARRR